jgi:hypothetical protein
MELQRSVGFNALNVSCLLTIYVLENMTFEFPDHSSSDIVIFTLTDIAHYIWRNTPSYQRFRFYITRTMISIDICLNGLFHLYRPYGGPPQPFVGHNEQIHLPGATYHMTVRGLLRDRYAKRIFVY